MCTFRNKTIAFVAVLTFLLASSCKKEEPVTDLVSFEDLPLNASGYWNGSDGSGGFTSGNVRFGNSYNNQYQSWSGFAYSNTSDTETADYSNQYSSITGTGDQESEKYGVYYFSGIPDTVVFTVPEKVTGLSVCNTTYAYLSILNGNSFCRKFGGDNGTDPDWFKLTLIPIDSRGNILGEMDIYLADFRFTDSANDYIANVWTKVDLSAFGYMKRLVIKMSSSDSGEWGMNNPAYVCIDNITGELQTF